MYFCFNRRVRTKATENRLTSTDIGSGLQKSYGWNKSKNRCSQQCKDVTKRGCVMRTSLLKVGNDFFICNGLSDCHKQSKRQSKLTEYWLLWFLRVWRTKWRMYGLSFFYMHTVGKKSLAQQELENSNRYIKLERQRAVKEIPARGD